MEKETFEDTLESISTENELLQSRITDLENSNENIYSLISDHKAKNKKRSIAYYEKRANKEKDIFVKQYVGGWGTLLEWKKSGKLSASDLGRFALLCEFLEKGSGVLVHPITRQPMSKTQMCKELGEQRQNFGGNVDKLIRLDLMQRKTIDGKEVYLINPKYSFNGESRIKVLYTVFNNCQFGDGVTINQMCN